MKLTKLILSLTLLLFISNCGEKKKDDSQNNAILLLALQNQNPGISGLYASLMARSNNGGGGGNYSNGSVSPFALISQSQNCPRGGNMTLAGDLTQAMNGASINAQFTGVKITYTACSLMAPNVESAGNSSQMLLEGELEQNGTMTVTVDPASTQSLLKTTGNSSMTISSSSYKVNGYLYPKFEVTFTTTGSKTTIENADDMDKAIMTIEETVEISGYVGNEKVSDSHSYKTQLKLK
ncbi:hypothetical protein DLM76_00670 [Leptospira yasudae]|uniref:Lipoprotein n=1 Tax=Leptospira yasudae TaxID=2202201 RepID=A0ABX9M2M8_9LEPT|nr:hypothetical protein [Leptospira yasudae]RHX79670.1 hypothetical protein DLM77_12385 [Leptospira yasudae]RHX95543.1 hypothetical protein DLM76_00670 [Leptospira yasudae]TGK27074.1 hypothetical protein EHQ05_09450 [Leptospira yasudae]TGM08133.1 hypothetical protein EHQ86_03725 [Leptospira yasudae]